ncbi:ArdC family protein [Dryocola clanedunensis]
MDRHHDIYQKVTDQIIVELEQDCIPWLRPWRDGEPPFPINALSGRPYHGINIPLLWSRASQESFASDRWLTFHQVRLLGGWVHKGEKSSLAVLYLPRFRELRDDQGKPLLDDTGTPRRHHFGIAREFRLFNLSQCDGLPSSLYDPVSRPDQPVEAAEAIVAHSGVKVRHRVQSQAYYQPATDRVMMPHPLQFESREAYYATLLHELTHATGHPSRLNRTGIANTGAEGEAYAMEEMVAEMGSAFLCAHCGIEGRLQHASYISYWLALLRQDKHAVIRASGMARNACEWLFNTTPQRCQ